jgi:orotidine-5'-phosphate decarboxylase
METAKDRLIVALDVPDVNSAILLVEQLWDHVGMFKIGLELKEVALTQMVHTDKATAFSHQSRARHLFTMLRGSYFDDAKLLDIPNTVAGAVHAITMRGARMLNVHCGGGVAMMEAALAAATSMASRLDTERPLILGVTILTSLKFEGLVAVGLASELDIASAEELEERKRTKTVELVSKLALLAQRAGLDGVIASPKEIVAIRQVCGPDFLIATPGIRPLWAAETQDQARVATPASAIRDGADFVIVGRPITNPPAEIGSPVAAAQKIVQEISDALAEKEK